MVPLSALSPCSAPSNTNLHSAPVAPCQHLDHKLQTAPSAIAPCRIIAQQHPQPTTLQQHHARFELALANKDSQSDSALPQCLATASCNTGLPTSRHNQQQHIGSAPSTRTHPATAACSPGNAQPEWSAGTLNPPTAQERCNNWSKDT